MIKNNDNNDENNVNHDTEQMSNGFAADSERKFMTRNRLLYTSPHCHAKDPVCGEAMKRRTVKYKSKFMIRDWAPMAYRKGENEARKKNCVRRHRVRVSNKNHRWEYKITWTPRLFYGRARKSIDNIGFFFHYHCEINRDRRKKKW